VSGRRLSDLLGAPFGAVADVANLLPAWPGYAPTKGDRFPTREARRAADQVLECDRQHGTLILLGRGVAEAFGLADLPFFKWRRLADGRLVVVIPHPSGVSRWWNEASRRAAARAYLRAAVCSGPWEGARLRDDAPRQVRRRSPSTSTPSSRGRRRRRTV
jgi:hypothetical protein